MILTAQITLIFLLILSIIAQLPHTYAVFQQSSKFQGRAGKIQASAFCLIASLAIFLFVWIGIMWLALFAVAVEFIFNIYYYTDDWWKNGWSERKKLTRFWRQRWIKFFIAALIPAFMYVFSWLLKNLEGVI
jgi:hypothetical protein